jgi:hypothetical protein
VLTAVFTGPAEHAADVRAALDAADFEVLGRTDGHGLPETPGEAFVDCRRQRRRNEEDAVLTVDAHGWRLLAVGPTWDHYDDATTFGSPLTGDGA